jgi:hypothetical protein
MSFYFSFTKPQNRRVEQVLSRNMGVGISGRGEDVEKGCRRVSIVQILCTHVCEWKNNTCCNYSMNGGRRIKDSGEGDKFKFDIFDIL